MTMGSHVRAGLLSTALFIAGVAPSWAGLIIKFVNDNPDYTNSNVFVTFGGATTGFAGTIIGGGALSLGQSYSLTQLQQGVDLAEFYSGRIFVSLGRGLTSPNVGNGYAPNFANPSLGDYKTRWDKVELTYQNGTGGANLTAQDFFSVPLEITASGGGVPTSTLKTNANTATILEALAKLSNFSLAEQNGAFNPYGAIVTGAGGVTIPGVSQPVIRIVNPSTVTAMPNGSTVYPSFAPYINYIENNDIVTMIAGSNATGADPHQKYNFTTTIAKTSYTLGGTTVSPGDLVFTGTVTSGSGQVVPTIAIITAANLTDHAIYGANVSFQVVQGADTNGAVTRAVADYLSALNFGLIGSNEPNPNDPGKTIGQSPSWTWYGNNPNGSTSAKLPITDAFAAAQPSNPYYNQVAAYLVGVTDAYGFAYNDRLQLPLLTLNNGSTLTITVQPDVMPSSGAAVPEPATLPLMAGAVVLLLVIRSQRCA